MVRALANGASRVVAPLIVPIVDQASSKNVQFADDLHGIEVIAPNVVGKMRVILYLHGGGFYLGSVWTHREFFGRLSAAAKAPVVAVDYRLAPEHPYPAALEDTLTAYQWLRKTQPKASIAVAGDSAGGNLAFALLVRLTQLGLPQPVSCVGLSPLLMLREFKDNHRLYVQGNLSLFRDPLVSPALADLATVRQFPPILLQADEGEYLAPDTRHMVKICREAGVSVDLKMYTDTIHGFQCYPVVYPKTKRDALERIAKFLEKNWNTNRTTLL